MSGSYLSPWTISQDQIALNPAIFPAQDTQIILTSTCRSLLSRTFYIGNSKEVVGEVVLQAWEGEDLRQELDFWLPYLSTAQ